MRKATHLRELEHVGLSVGAGLADRLDGSRLLPALPDAALAALAKLPGVRAALAALAALGLAGVAGLGLERARLAWGSCMMIRSTAMRRDEQVSTTAPSPTLHAQATNYSSSPGSLFAAAPPPVSGLRHFGHSFLPSLSSLLREDRLNLNLNPKHDCV